MISKLNNGLKRLTSRPIADQAAQPLLAGYRRTTPPLRRSALLTLLAIACIGTGVAFAIMAPSRMTPFAAPPAILLGLIIWCLPAGDYAPTRFLEPLFIAFFASLLIWPNYLAVAVSNLPWMTVARLTGVPLALTLLACLSISRAFRTQLMAILNADPLMFKLVVALFALWGFSVLISINPGMSLNLYILALLRYAAIFFVSCYLFARPGFADMWAKMLMAMLMLLCVFGMWEFRIQHLPWSGHIPSFLKIDDPLVQKALTPKISREMIYRIKVTATTPLGLAELLGLAVPFALHFLLGKRRILLRAIMAVYLPLSLFVILLTDSRLGVVAAFASGLFYVLILAVLRWRQNKGSLLAPAIVLSYPALFAAALAATFVVPQLKYKFWGRGAQQASTEARWDQWEKGLPKIFARPYGHGIGQGSPALQWTTPGGTVSIDTYWLSVMLEIGVVGFIVFYGLMLRGAFTAARTVVNAAGRRDADLLLPMSVSLLTFVIVKMVFSQDANHPLIFMILGGVLALTYRAQTAKVGNNPIGTEQAPPSPQPATERFGIAARVASRTRPSFSPR